ncbi:MAG: hypothetical protein JWN68_1765 [Nocardioides sp.]|jgi:hypothetical protein|uniref:hypothetical protein n=1 Tax=Nocardioides sp. TaxID=35761 RepID=UPI002630A875|nr:hypothetical protein [Nocardioides sp.]MCW2833812.1 hypothetical protein [Nocardioides sp.]
MAVALVAAGAPVLLAAGMTPASADAAPGSTPDNPIQVASPSAVPAGSTQTGSTTTGCATTTTWTHTVPAVAETFHPEYRYKRDFAATYRTETRSATKQYTPGRDAVAPAKEYEYRLYEKKQKARWDGANSTTYSGVISWGYSGSYDWTGQSTYAWGTTAPAGTGPARGESIHNHNGTWYFTYWTEYRATGNSRDKAGTGSPATNGSWSSWSPQLNFSDGWTGAEPATPPVKSGSGTYPALTWNQSRTVVDRAAYTEYYVAGGAPSRDAAAASWIAEPSLAGWTRFQERSVSNNDAKPAVVTYYAYNDNKVCETVAPAPTPDVEVLGEEAGRVTGKIYTSCQRTVRVTMKNASSRAVVYKVKVGNKVTTKKVKAESTVTFTTTGQHRDMAKLMLGSTVLAKKRVPEACPAPEVLPETGKRHQ